MFGPRAVEAQGGFGPFQVEQVFAAGQGECAGLGQAPLALLQQVGAVRATARLAFQGVFEGAGGLVRAIDLA